MREVYKKKSTRKTQWLITVAAVTIAAGIMGTGWGANNVLADSPPPSSPDATCPAGGQCFADVTSGNPFYAFINRIYQQDLVTGYPCGGTGEPCDPQGRPYYRPINGVTRQQMAKFIDNARHLSGIDIEVNAGIPPIIAHNNTGTAISAYSTSGQALTAQSVSQIALYAQTGESMAVAGYSTGSTDASYGVYGTGNTGVYGGGNTGVKGVGNTGVQGESTNSAGYGVVGYNTVNGGIGVYGQSTGNGEGVHGSSPTGNGVYGISSGAYGSGVYGSNIEGGNGVYGVSDGDGVFGVSTDSGAGVHGSAAEIGVLGNSIGGHGVEGNSYSGVGVYGSSGTQGGWAGYFQGNINVTGNCTGCLGSSKIDDPLDPENKYLYHSAVQSPDMIDIYRGHVTLDAEGSATVQLPSYFEALNRDFDYQLTPVGAPMPNLYIAQEVQGNNFKIAGGKPGSKVSWQVTGTRHDPYTNAHPIQPEQDKPADEKGKYLHPAEYGQPDSAGLNYDENRSVQHENGNR